MKRLNLVTLGARDLKKTKQFYEKLFGWKPAPQSTGDVIFYDMGGSLVALYPWQLLAEDAKLPPHGRGFSGITLAHNVRSKEEVKEFISKAVSLGGALVKAAQDVFWGGHSGYFSDPNGHLWEVAWNPFFPLKKDGSFDLKKKLKSKKKKTQ